MVKYVRIKKENRDRIFDQMSIRYRQTTNLYRELLWKMSVMLTAAINKGIPQEVLDFTVKYPKLVRTETDLTINLQKFVYDKFIYSEKWPYIKMQTYYPGIPEKFEEEVMNGSFERWKFGSYKCVNWIKMNCPELMAVINEGIEEMKKVIEWEKSLRCVLSQIKTLNKMKEELPEAYEVYMQLYGDPDKSGFCDAIEKVRAEYSQTKENN